jgi:subtilisin family serine protease
MTMGARGSRAGLKVLGPLAAFFLSLLLPCPAPAWLSPESRTALIAPSPWREGEAMVRLRPGATLAGEPMEGGAVPALAGEYPRLSPPREGRLALVRAPGTDTVSLVRRLRRDPAVAGAWPNFILAVSALPDDPLFGQQWSLHNEGQEILGSPGLADADVDAPEGWDLTTGSPEVAVAVIDTGVDWTHRDLAGAVWTNPGESPDNGLDDDGNGWVDDVHGLDAVNGDGSPMDDYGHGTHVAGTIAAVGDNGYGVAGVAWRTTVVPCKAFDSEGFGTVAEVIRCLDYLVDLKRNRGVNLVAANASFGWTYNGVVFTPAEFGFQDGDVLSQAIAAAGEAGILLVAASGNFGLNNDVQPPARVVYPASYTLESVVSVAASDRFDQPAPFSNWGDRSVDLYAPGHLVLSTIPGGCYRPGTGADFLHDGFEEGDAGWRHHGLNDTWTLDEAEGGAGLVMAASVEEGDRATDALLDLAADLNLLEAGEQTLSVGFRATSTLTEGGGATLKVSVSLNGGVTWLALDSLAGPFPERTVNLTLPFSWRSDRVRLRFALSAPAGSPPGQRLVLDDVGIGTAPSCGFAYASGTSMAAPHVSGAVALMAALHPAEGLPARRNRLLQGVDRLPQYQTRVVSGGRLNLARSLGPDIPPLVTGLDPADGALAGARVAVRGINYGAERGTVVLEGSTEGSFGTPGFMVRFFLRSNADGVGSRGVSVDDVEISSDRTVYFRDDMETDDGRWTAAGVPMPWTRSSFFVHGGSYAWETPRISQPWGVNYPYNCRTWIRTTHPVDLSGAAGERVYLRFWGHVEVMSSNSEDGDAFEVQFSRDGGLTWRPAGSIPGGVGWRHFQFPVPTDDRRMEAEVLDWSDTEASFMVPAGAFSHVRVVNAVGIPSSNAALLSSWREHPPFPDRDDGFFTAVPFGGKVWLFGSWDLGNDSRSMQVLTYDPSGGVWRNRRDLQLPEKRLGAAAAACGGKIYLAGGDGYTDRASLDILDPLRGVWTSGPSLPEAVVWHQLVCLEDGIHLLGGDQIMGSTRPSHYRYAPGEKRWTRLADMTEARHGFAAAAARGRIWVFGGSGADYRPLAEAESYDPGTDQWYPLPDLPQARRGQGAAADGRRIYLSGGTFHDPYTPLADTLVFDTEEERWEDDRGGTILDLPVPDSGLTMGFLPGHGVFAAGGQRQWNGTPRGIAFLDVQRLSPAVEILSPDGGERLAAGETITVVWGAPPEAVLFSLDLSSDGGRTWKTVADSIPGTAREWRVPVPGDNLRECRLRISARDAGGNSLGSDTTDDVFRVENVRLLWPFSGAMAKSGESRVIGWRTFRTRRPVARTQLWLSLDLGETWKLLAALRGNPGRYRWRVPDTGTDAAYGHVRVVLKDAAGRTVGSDGNDYAFYIWNF